MHGGICIDRNGLRRADGAAAWPDSGPQPGEAPATVRVSSGMFGDNAFLRALEERIARSGSDMSAAPTPMAHSDFRDSAQRIMSTAAEWQRGLLLPFLRDSQGGGGAAKGRAGGGGAEAP